jgi:hypothetical protein
MKRSLFQFFILTALITASSCGPRGNHDGKIDSNDVNISASANGKVADGQEPVMTFTTEMHDFGKITQGQRVKYAFKFKNTGPSELIISDAQGSCGCTVPDWPNKPVAPGEEGIIGVEFNSEGKSGNNEKTVRITTNAKPQTKVITIRAQVMVPEPKPTK